MQARSHDLATSVGLLILRVGAAGYMLTHGWGKLQMIRFEKFDQFGDPIGLGNTASLILATSAEFGCSLLVLAGLATRLAALPVVVTMLVAAFVAHKTDPWTMATGAQRFMSGSAESWASKEPALIYLTAFLPLVFTGAGRFSLDALIWRGRKDGSPEAIEGPTR